MTTILNIAKLAGVSKSTVSRVLNNGVVSLETRKAVEKVIQETNYSPSYFAQTIRTRKSRTIAMMIPDASNLFYTEMFKAVETVALENEYMVIMCDTQNSSAIEIEYAEKLMKRMIDGLIYCTYTKSEENEKYFVSLSKRKPIVFMDYAFAENTQISYVVTEGYNSVRKVVQHLFDKGRRRIAFIGLPKNTTITLPRFEGYKKGLEDCSLKYDASIVYHPDPDPEKSLIDIGFSGAKHLLDGKKRPDAIMAAADPLAIGVLRYLRDQKVRVPQDISVTGFDNNALCLLVEPHLTTVAQPIKELGTLAAKILLERINGMKYINNRIILDGILEERDST